MKRIITLLSFYIFVVSFISYAKGHSIPVYPDDSLFNKLTDINRQFKEFTTKDTLRGYSTPIKIEASNYFQSTMPQKNTNRDKNGLIILPFEYEPFVSYINFNDTIIQDPSMLPVVFDGNILPKDMTFTKDFDIMQKGIFQHNLVNRDSIVAPRLYRYKHTGDNRYKLIRKENTLNPDLWQKERIKETRKNYYTAHPDLIKSNALEYDGSPIIQREVERKNPFQELISTGDAIQIARPTIAKTEIKQVFWKTWGEHKLDVSQKAYSENWSPATNNNFQIQNYHKFNAKYKKDKIEFDHWIEWRLNVQSVSLSKEDKEKNPNYNSFLIGDDWIRTYNKLGLESFIKRWSYILTLDVKTPVFNKYPQYPKNADISSRTAGFLSPLDLNFGIGAGYTLEKNSKTVKNRGFKLSIDATPFSYNLKYVKSDKVWHNNNYGVVYDEKKDKGKTKDDRRYSKMEFGSTINTTIGYSLNGFTDFNSRIKYFTNYERSYLECENTINFRLNRYLSTSLYVYMKFDDAVGIEKKDDTWGYFSFNEVLGFGLSYKW